MDDLTPSAEATTPAADTDERLAAQILAELGLSEPTATMPLPDDDQGDLAAPTDEDEARPDGADDAEEDSLSLALDEEEPKTPETDEDEPKLDLDPELAAHPKLKERWEQQQRGVQKLVDRLKTERQQNQNLLTWADALANPDTQRDAYRQLGMQLGLVDSAAPAAPTSDEPITEDWEALGYDSRGEYLAEQRARAAAERRIKEIEQRVAPALDELERMRADKARADQERRFEQALDKVSPKVAQRIEKLDAGWKVTREMVAEAVRALPQLANDPVKAVQKHYSDQRAQHYAQASKQRKAVPDMVTGATAPPRGSRTDPSRATADEILADFMSRL